MKDPLTKLVLGVLCMAIAVIWVLVVFNLIP